MITLSKAPTSFANNRHVFFFNQCFSPKCLLFSYSMHWGRSEQAIGYIGKINIMAITNVPNNFL